MSLIEKAAKRLEELQRAGAVIADTNASATGVQAPAVVDKVPLPEAAMRAANALRAATESSPAASTPAAAPAPKDAGRAPLRRVDINFERLALRSFVTPDNPHSAIAHEFRTLKRPLLRNVMGADGVKVANANLIVVTSSLPGEGKTFVATNLVISMAMEVNRTVMLVDGDVAHPSLPGILDIPSAPGLLDLLVRDDLDIDDVLLQTNIEGLTIIPAGHRDRRSTELLASPKMSEFLRVLAFRFPERIIVFDSPPLLPTTEAPVLAGHMGQVVMVVGANSTPRHVVTQALALIDRCDVVLMLLNKATKSMGSTYYGYYADGDPE